SESWGWSLACCGRDRELAEEVLQSVYLRIISGRAKFGGESSFKTWVFGVIRWTARSELRRRRLSWWRQAESGAAVALIDPTIGADVAAEDSDRREALVAALAALSRRQKEVLQLVFYHDMTIEEAARVMNVSLGSARTHYERGKKALAEKLRRESEA
ncbi:MAG: RNA polymerase sigma factor, partial [Gemmatimonadaceae bacterium]